VVDDAEAGERYNRAARVVAGWIRDPEFSDADGNPKILTLQEAQAAGGGLSGAGAPLQR